METIKLVYAKYDEEILLLPVSELEKVKECWSIAESLQQKNASFDEAVKTFQNKNHDLYNYCVELGSVNKDQNFFISEDYYDRTEFASIPRTMLYKLPKPIVTEFVNKAYSANGELLTFIDSKREQELIKYCDERGFNLREDPVSFDEFQGVGLTGV